MPPKTTYTAAQKAAYKEKKLKAAVKVAKAVTSARKIVGRGDYRPSSMTRVRGRGDYFSDLLGGAGHALGSLAGGAIGKLFGSGDYYKDGPGTNSLWKHRSPSSAAVDASSVAGSNPSMAPFTMGAMSVQFDEGPPRITHREFIGPVIASGDTGFHTQTYRIQPGLRGANVLFPWGSSVAACFQQYELLGMVLEYRTTSSNFASNSALGTVMLSTVYDANASPLSTQQAVDNNDYTTSSVPSASVYHPIECASKESPTVIRYIRQSNTPTSESDERLDDVGLFQVSQSGCTAAVGTQLGELWATYDIKFYKAALPDIHSGTSWQATATTSGPVWPTTVNVAASSSLPATYKSSTKQIMLPSGYAGAFILTMQVAPVSALDYITAADVTGGGIQFGTDVTQLSIFASNGGALDTAGNAFGSLVGANQSSEWIVNFAFSTVAENPAQNFITLDVGWGVAGTSGTSNVNLTAFITAVDSDFITNSASLERELVRISKNPAVQALLTSLIRQPALTRCQESEYEEEAYVRARPPTPVPSALTASAAAAESRASLFSPFQGGRSSSAKK